MADKPQKHADETTPTYLLRFSAKALKLRLQTLSADRRDIARRLFGWEGGPSWPVIPMRGTALFPGMTMSFDIGRPASLLALKEALRSNRELFVVAQKNEADEEPDDDDLYTVGCLARVRQVLEMRDDSGDGVKKVLLAGTSRARLIRLDKVQPGYLRAYLEPLESNEAGPEDLQAKAAYRMLTQNYARIAALSGRIPPERVQMILARTDWGLASDEIAVTTIGELPALQQVLETLDVRERMIVLGQKLAEELRVVEYERELRQKVRGKLDRNQQEYYLREQLRTIQEELGETDGEDDERSTYQKKLEKSLMPDSVREKVKQEIDRLARMPSSSPEAGIIRNWIDLLVELPFGQVDKEKLQLVRARRILARDHYGLTRVKERIMEYLAVQKLATEAEKASRLTGPILCFAGPPGVGKTSIAKSIAEAMGRRYVRMSLGGIRDEAEIRGHRRTYIGAMPGRIIKAIHQVGSDNPLFLLDEIDKLGSDYRGDPSSALLEVLDPEQNTNFRDHYLEVPYDLSNVLFITTANAVETIPQALLDRMEVIEIEGYTEEEKIEIARRHLLPKQLARHALTKGQLSLPRRTIARLIAWYTREAGVRQLERELAHLCRRAAIEIAEKGVERVTVRPDDLERHLGIRKYRYDEAAGEDQVGSATGLAWTWAGGDTLTIEANVLPGDGRLELTGHLGDVMKESAKAALTYVRSRSQELGLDDGEFGKKDIHIHVPAGAIPKDGPSAGITLATALVSAFTGRAVRHNVAMTGEVTLRGNVLAIGGLKEKAVAARRAGIDTILIPEENLRDVADLPDTVKKAMRIVPVRHMDQVLEEALAEERKPDGD